MERMKKFGVETGDGHTARECLSRRRVARCPRAKLVNVTWSLFYHKGGEQAGRVSESGSPGAAVSMPFTMIFGRNPALL